MKPQTIVVIALACVAAFVTQVLFAALLVGGLLRPAAPPVARFALPPAIAVAPAEAFHVQVPVEQPCAPEELGALRGSVVPAADYAFTGPHTHGNLALFLIRGADALKGQKLLPLQQALEQQLAVVHEGGIRVENRADVPVFIQAGDIIKGGCQDRVVPYDQVIPPGVVGLPLSVFCVEAGRSGPRGLEASRSFDSATEQLPGRQLLLAARYLRSQQEVWNGVSRTQQSLARNLGGPVQAPVSQTSLQLTLENERVRGAVQAAFDRLLPLPQQADDVIGVAAVVNGQLQGADVYASSALFRALWPKLLKAHLVAALAEPAPDATAPAPSADALRQFLADAEAGQPSQQRLGNGAVALRLESPRAVLFESCDPALPNAVLHRSFLAR